jgi:hypothetical protein
MKGLICVLVICSMCLASAQAKAMAPPGGLFIAVIAIEIGAVVCTIGNLAYAIKGKRPGWTWLAGGYITAVLNIAVGLFICSEASSDDPEVMAIGLGFTAFGALDLGFTIWANTQPRRSYRVSIAPMVIPDARGNAALGVGLQVVGW